MKSVLLGMAVVFAALQYKLWLSPAGLPGVQGIQNQISAQQNSNEVLAKNNAVLLQHIDALKQGGTALEASARDELGMVKQGEIFYQTVG